MHGVANAKERREQVEALFERGHDLVPRSQRLDRGHLFGRQMLLGNGAEPVGGDVGARFGEAGSDAAEDLCEDLVEAVEQRPRETSQILGASGIVTDTHPGRTRTTRTRIRSSHQQEPRRQAQRGAGARDTNDTLFEGLTQRIEHTRGKLAELIEKQHSLGCQ